MALKSSGWQLEPDFRECLDARILILLIVASGDADPADQLPVFQDRIASADSDHPGAIGQRRHFWIVRNIVVPDMGGVPKRGGTPSLVDGNIDGEKRRVISALERAQVTGGVDDGDRLIEAVAMDFVMKFPSPWRNPSGVLEVRKDVRRWQSSEAFEDNLASCRATFDQCVHRLQIGGINWRQFFG